MSFHGACLWILLFRMVIDVQTDVILWSSSNYNDFINHWNHSNVDFFEFNNGPELSIHGNGYIEREINTLIYHNLSIYYILRDSVNYPLDSNEYCGLYYYDKNNHNKTYIDQWNNANIMSIANKLQMNMLPEWLYNSNPIFIGFDNNGSSTNGDRCYVLQASLHGKTLRTHTPTNLFTHTPTTSPVVTTTLNPIIPSSSQANKTPKQNISILTISIIVFALSALLLCVSLCICLFIYRESRNKRQIDNNPIIIKHHRDSNSNSKDDLPKLDKHMKGELTYSEYIMSGIVKSAANTQDNQRDINQSDLNTETVYVN